jgi:hypothetical protein
MPRRKRNQIPDDLDSDNGADSSAPPPAPARQEQSQEVVDITVSDSDPGVNDITPVAESTRSAADIDYFFLRGVKTKEGLKTICKICQ